MFSIKNSFEERITYSIGQIVNISGFKFGHNLVNDKGFCSSPIMLINNKINEIQVIRIYKEINYFQEINNGIFIEKIIIEFTKMLFNNVGKNMYRMQISKIDIDCFFTFISDNLSINFSVSCRREDNFSKIEEKLFQNYPELRYKKIKFKDNGKKN